MANVPPPPPFMSLKERAELWLSNGSKDTDLATTSKEELQRELREWIDWRFRNYAETKELRVACQQKVQTILDAATHGEMPPQDILRSFPDEADRNVARADDLVAEQDDQNNQAAFLLESLKVKHGVQGQDIPADAPNPADARVVHALMALGQADINAQTLHELDDVEDEERLRANLVRQTMERANVVTMMERERASSQGSGRSE